MNEALFHGSGAALVTPFQNGEVDFSSLGQIIDMQLAEGTDALIVLGTTGEPPTLTADEKDRILSFVMERTAGCVPVIVGCGGNNTAETVRRARRAEQLGANGLLAVTPYYNKTTQAGLIAHYTAVADAVSIPLILYNVPSRTGMNLLPETAARLSEHPHIQGVKEASGNISQIAELAALTHGSLALYSGNDDQTLPILALGGQGVVSVAANVIPRQIHELVFRWMNGDLEGSRALQYSILPLIRELFSEVSPVPVKAALHLLGLCSPEVRLPLVSLNIERYAKLRATLGRCLAIEERL